MSLKKNKILVTGAEGFIGSHLVEYLVKEGCNVKALIHYNFLNSWGWLDELSRSILDKVEVVAGDVRDRSLLENIMSDCEKVFHLAALIGIPYSYFAPQSYVETNIIGTLNILENAKKLKTGKVLITSTSEVYGSAQYVPINENHPFQGQSPYSATKIAADKLAESFHRSFNLPVCIVRPFNTYGPRQSARAIIPTIITQILSGEKKIFLGNLNAKRDLNFVTDVVNAFVEISNCKLAVGEEINIASETEISVIQLANKILNIFNSNAKIISKKNRFRPKESEVNRLLGSSEKLRRITKWKPKVSIDDGLKETIEWFKNPNVLSKYKSMIYNI